MTMRQVAKQHEIQYSRLCQICRGDVGSISSDAIVDVLGAFGYRITGIVGSGEGTEIVLSLDKPDKVLPEIEVPAFLDPDFREAFGISAEFNPDEMNSNDLVDNPDSFYGDEVDHNDE